MENKKLLKKLANNNQKKDDIATLISGKVGFK